MIGYQWVAPVHAKAKSRDGLCDFGDKISADKEWLKSLPARVSDAALTCNYVGLYAAPPWPQFRMP